MNIFGMLVSHDDVVYADVDGAVVIPAGMVRSLSKAIELIARREKVILDCAPGFNPRAMREALRQSAEIH